MSLERQLKTAVDRLRSGALDNEAQVKLAVILPVLRELGWDDADPRELKPEFPVGRGAVDYALLNGGHPLVFVETAPMGGVDAGGHRRLFRHASTREIPFLVLTDGNRWDFFFCMAEGGLAERRFHSLEFLHERNIPECADFLEKHLGKDPVVSGEARRSAEMLLASELKRRKASDAIRGAWRALVEERDEMLRDLLAERVESDCGTPPEPGDVEIFLRGLVLPAALSPPGPRPEGSMTRIVGFVLDGKRVETGSAIETLVELVKKFHRRDPQFMTNFALASGGRKRPLVARNRADLYFDRLDFQQNNTKNLGNGWWLDARLRTHKGDCAAVRYVV